MLSKIKTVFSIIGAFLTVLFFTVLLFLLRRGKADRTGSTADSDRDRRIKEGIGNCEDGIERCEEHLRRAEDILREAIERSRKEGNNS